MGKDSLKSKVESEIEDDGYDPTSIDLPDSKSICSLVCEECSNIKLKYTLCSNSPSGLVEMCNQCSSKTTHKYIIHD